MGRPKSILDQAAKVQATIVEIRLLCDELLDRNVYRITQYANGKCSATTYNPADAIFQLLTL